MSLPSIFHIREPQSANRIELLDFLRGAGMLLVLLHHSDIPQGKWILTFHMPLLFLLSGYTMYLRPHSAGFQTFITGRFLRLVVPYFLFEGLNLAVWSISLLLQGGWQDLSEAIRAIVYCLNTEAYTGYYGRLWFWPCMFVSDILFSCILRLAPRRQGLRKTFLAAMVLVTLLISWITCKILPERLPFAADTAFMATAFLIMGYLFGSLIQWLIQKAHLWADICVLLPSLLAMRYLVLYGHTAMLMYDNQYGHFVNTVCAACCGILVFLILAKWLYHACCRTGFGKDLVLWYGYHSLATFPVHLSIKMWIWQVFPLSFRKWYILLPAMLLLNIPLVNCITRYFPFLLGNFSFLKKKQTSK